MEPLFINKYQHSKENYIEMNKAYTGTKFLVFRIVLLVLFFILSAFWYFELYSLTGCITVAFIGIVITAFPSIHLRYSASKHEKRFIVLHNCVPEATTFFVRIIFSV